MSDVEPIISTEYSELGDREMQRAIAFMRAVWKLGACRTCEGTHYDLMALVMLRVVGNVNTLSDSTAHRRPAASLICSSCGEVRLLDLTVAGIVPREPGNPTPPGPTTGPYR